MDFQKHNLVAFGCSFTYGHGLKDCVIDQINPGPNPSKYAWPTYLSLRLKCNGFENKGIPGASNKIIQKEVLKHDFQENSFVVVLWSTFHRKTIFQDKKHNIHMLPHFLDPNKMPNGWRKTQKQDFLDLVQNWYGNFHFDYDAYYDFCTTLSFVHNYLKDKKIKSYHLFEAEELNRYKSLFNSMKPKDLNAKTVRWKRDFHIDDAYDTAKGNPHPGHESHQHFARFIEQWIKKCD